MAAEISTSINIKEPRWDQSTFMGRAKHFFTVTDPRNILLTNEQLDHAHKIITDYRYAGGSALTGGGPAADTPQQLQVSPSAVCLPGKAWFLRA